MYVLFRRFKWNPRKYYEMDEGEQMIVRAFVSQYSDDMEDLERRMSDYG